MATIKPRITITLSNRGYEVLKSISDCSGRPMSSFVSEMLDSASPTLERMAATFQKIKQAQDSERARFLESIDDAQSAIEPVVMKTLGQFDLFLGQIEAAVDTSTEREVRAPGGVASAALTTPTNRGVTPTATKRLRTSIGNGLKSVLKK